jgi:amidase
VSDEARAGVAHIEEVLRACGHDVRRHDPDYGLAAQNLTTRYLGGIHEDVSAVPRPEALEPRTRGFGRLGGAYPRSIVRRAWRAAAADANRIQRSLASYDVLLTPTVCEPAIEVGRWHGRGALRTLVGLARTFAFTPIWNHTGQPAAAVPAGFTSGGLPRSVSLVGKPGDEATLLSLAAQIEAETEWPAKRPPGF